MTIGDIVISTPFVIGAILLTGIGIFKTLGWKIALTLLGITIFSAASTWGWWSAPITIKILFYNGCVAVLWTVIEAARFAPR